MKIIFTVRNDFYAEGKVAATSSTPPHIFSMNWVEGGHWTLALDVRYRGIFETFEQALAELRRLTKS